MKFSASFRGDDGRRHEYCIYCGEESIDRLEGDGTLSFSCRRCGKHSERSILVTPEMKWWVDADDEYWHESSGVLVKDGRGRFLFFKRTMYPFGLTMPAGHVEADESPIHTAVRELEEEVGIKARHLALIFSGDMVGDSCNAGSDAHRWHVYLCDYEGREDIEVREEGKNAVWLTLADAFTEDLTIATRKIIEKCRGLVADPPPVSSGTAVPK